MEYAKLIDAAKKRHGWTDYKVAKALKYKNISAIYQVRSGRQGMSAERYRALLVLANGEVKSGSLYIMLSSHNAANEAVYLVDSMRYAA
jgi:hypothetical protein